MDETSIRRRPARRPPPSPTPIPPSPVPAPWRAHLATVHIMPTGTPAAETGDPAGLRALGGRVTAALDTFLAQAEPILTGIGPELEPAARAARDFVLAGGKRLRPAFCYWGWRGAGA